MTNLIMKVIEIKYCSNSGNITGKNSVGGIIGYLTVQGCECNVIVSNCSNRAVINGYGDVGGIIGNYLDANYSKNIKDACH